MAILKGAFDALIKLNSRAVVLKRLGTPDLYSSARIARSNFFAFLQGPSATTIAKREFVIPRSAMTGTSKQEINLSDTPTEGAFILSYDGNDTTEFTEASTASDIQVALRLLTGLENVTVTGSFASKKFVVAFVGVQSPILLTATKTTGDELDADISIVKLLVGDLWSPMIKKGDRIIDSVYGNMAVNEIIEMTDIGGEIIGFRVRME